jgi:2-keto-4-pentenoate hydratase/2-oxohepta-3-ene-1,7-dioic acid hydratase in catechol pathway
VIIGAPARRVAVDTAVDYGEMLQDTTTDLMIFGVPELISSISQFTTLLPGDVILTGTPGGVGLRRDPQVWLRDGNRTQQGRGHNASIVRRFSCIVRPPRTKFAPSAIRAAPAGPA